MRTKVSLLLLIMIMLLMFSNATFAEETISWSKPETIYGYLVV